MVQYINSKEAAKRWQCSEQWVAILCRKGKLEGAVKEGRSWLIPEDTPKPLERLHKLPVEELRKTSLPLPIGISDYMRAESSYYYVDKTLLIKELLDDGAVVSLFMRPRRFGKTLALNMLKVFFEKSELDTSAYFKFRNIWRCGDYYRSFQGRYPVIYLSFKDVKCTTWEETLEHIGMLLQGEYIRHQEALQIPEMAFYGDYIKHIIGLQASSLELMRALEMLSLFLGKYYGSKVVILIDEYDTPIQQSYAYGFYDKVLNFMRNFLSGGLKDNNYLFKGVLTGILRVSKENLFSGLNNITVDTVLDKRYAEYFGFTETEVDAMAEYYDRIDAIDIIREWYDGYTFGNKEIYNPWSVTNYFNNACEPKPFWANTGENRVLKELLCSLTEEKAEALAMLMEEKNIVAKLNFNIIYPQLKDSPDTIFSFLLLAGYLKTVQALGEDYYQLALPNKEIKQIYRDEIISWLNMQLDNNSINKLRKALVIGDSIAIESYLNSFLESVISCFDYGTEGFYHGMMLGIAAVLSDKYEAKSNRESGLGRFDLALEPYSKALPGFIMEFKAVSKGSEDDLNKLAEKALQQIIDKEYDVDMKRRGFGRLVRLGVAFCGKTVKICEG